MQDDLDNGDVCKGIISGLILSVPLWILLVLIGYGLWRWLI